MPIKIYQVDAFCRDLFSGNPAAVCPLGHWPEDALLQHIAAENNLAETAFFVKVDDHFRIRWFTPTVEVDLCGHATLAAAHVLFDYEQYAGSHILFLSRSGELTVSRQGDLLELDFPTDTLERVDITDEMRSWFPTAPQEAYKGRTDYLLVYPDEATIGYLRPNLPAIAKAEEARGVIITARGDRTDFVSRFFAPQSGIDEDPVTGSAHTSLTPYWSARLGKKELTAMQLSARKGYLQCTNRGVRTGISGAAKTYMIGELLLSLRHSLLALMLTAGLSFAGYSQIQVSQEPRHHKVFENEWVRVLDVRIPPHDTTLMHKHSTPSIFVVLSQTKTGSQVVVEPRRISLTAGNIWFESFYDTPRIHRVWNEDTSEFHVMDIELLHSPSSSVNFNMPNAQSLFDEKLVHAWKLTLKPLTDIKVNKTISPALVIGLSGPGAAGEVNEQPFTKKGDFLFVPAGSSLEVFNGSATADQQFAVFFFK